MPVRTITFSLTELESKLAELQRHFVKACEAANQDPNVLEIARDFADLPDETSEPWRHSAPR